MEVLAAATGVFEFLTLCNNGFLMIKAVIGAGGEMEEKLTRIQSHHGHFISWYEIWGDRESRQERFDRYAKERPLGAKEVLRQLALFSRLFYDLKALEKFGFTVGDAPKEEIRSLDGFRFESDDDLQRGKIVRFQAKCGANLSLMKKIKFVFRKRGEKLERLVSQLMEYNAVLWRYGPGIEVTRLEKGIYDQIGYVVAGELKSILSAFTAEAKGASDPVSAKKFQSLAQMTNFRAQVRQASGNARAFTTDDFLSLNRADYLINRRGTSTMALLCNLHRQTGHQTAVLIEWIDMPLLAGKKDATEKLAMLLSLEKPEDMKIPGCYGILDDLGMSGRLGIVLKPPPNIRVHLPPSAVSGAISRRRMPISLRTIITDGTHILPLGTKFNIAKQLVDTVHMIHAVEWVHKNVRAESILFFPSGTVDDTSPSFSSPPDFNNPLLAGFNNARSDYSNRRVPGDNMGGDGYFREDPAARNLTLDHYQHPEKVTNPWLAYGRKYDLYSLGCVLLELGLWATLDSFNETVQTTNAYDTMRAIRELASKARLDSRMGTIYGEVVRDCLALGEPTVTPDFSPARFGTDIASRLSQCVA